MPVLGSDPAVPLHCRETDENISEPQFINLSYVQAQHDYLAGNYPVVREDAAQVGQPVDHLALNMTCFTTRPQGHAAAAAADLCCGKCGCRRQGWRLTPGVAHLTAAPLGWFEKDQGSSSARPCCHWGLELVPALH